jgi:hypothetical protein
MSIVFVEAMAAIEIAYAQKVEVAVNGVTAWRLADLSAAGRVTPAPPTENLLPLETSGEPWLACSDSHLLAIQATELLTIAPAGLSPADQASRRWTHASAISSTP